MVALLKMPLFLPFCDPQLSSLSARETELTTLLIDKSFSSWFRHLNQVSSGKNQLQNLFKIMANENLLSFQGLTVLKSDTHLPIIGKKMKANGYLMKERQKARLLSNVRSVKWCEFYFPPTCLQESIYLVDNHIT